MRIVDIRGFTADQRKALVNEILQRISGKK